MPPALREQWDNVLRSLRDARVTSTATPGASDEELQAYTTINRFLSAFIDHSFRDLDYVVKVGACFVCVFHALLNTLVC